MIARRQKSRRQIETIVLACAIAWALLIATFAVSLSRGISEPARAGSSTSSAALTYEGMVTDSRCGAKHLASIARTATDCTIICVRAGGQFVLIDGDTGYVLQGDSVELKQVAGQRARIVGTLNGKTISVEAVTTLNAGR